VAGPARIGFSLKWPNDVMAGSAKLSGILLEAEAMPGGRLAVVVGMGTNVVAAPEDTPTPATSLRALGLETTAEMLFAALSDSWAECRGIWDEGRGFGEIRRRWLACAAGIGQPVAVHTGNATLSGIFDTIDDTGCMIVRTSTGDSVPVSAGDVYFGQAASARAG
jgi:BirA family transcriptional regulator, biotin operon repressor / biotin---[acetyl-CoA-carboxylase] ligase